MTIFFATLTLLGLLTIKHFIADFPLQTAYQYTNKGKYGHPGGILHAGIHAIFTVVCVVVTMYFFGAPNLPHTISILFGSAMIDFLVHYHCDWAKVRLTHHFGWASMGVDDNGRKCLRIYDNKYFIALGADQLVHGLTYVGIIAYVILALLTLAVL